MNRQARIWRRTGCRRRKATSSRCCACTGRRKVTFPLSTAHGSHRQLRGPRWHGIPPAANELNRTCKRRTLMYYTSDSLLPENMQPLIITAAPFGPQWMPSDYPEDIAVSWKAQVQKAVDCYNAGATLLHVHV